jgi:small subunit ribosomal protein S11
MAQAKRKDKAKKRVVVVEQVGQVHIKASLTTSLSPLPTQQVR